MTRVAGLGKIDTPLLYAALDNTQRPRRPCRWLYPNLPSNQNRPRFVPMSTSACKTCSQFMVFLLTSVLS